MAMSNRIFDIISPKENTTKYVGYNKIIFEIFASNVLFCIYLKRDLSLETLLFQTIETNLWFIAVTEV